MMRSWSWGYRLTRFEIHSPLESLIPDAKNLPVSIECIKSFCFLYIKENTIRTSPRLSRLSTLCNAIVLHSLSFPSKSGAASSRRVPPDNNARGAMTSHLSMLWFLQVLGFNASCITTTTSSSYQTKIDLDCNDVDHDCILNDGKTSHSRKITRAKVSRYRGSGKHAERKGR